MKKDSRPINTGLGDLMRFAWPIMALASITHRVAGVVLFAGVGLMLFALDMSLSGESGFAYIKELAGSPFGKFVTWALLAALAYHFVAGVKHLLMDLGLGETLAGGRRAAWLVIFCSLVLMALAAFWVL